jgi:membrane protein implicated in regulation of membrane protease activity
MTSYALRLGLAAIAFLVIGVLAILLFNALWFRIGLGTAFVLLSAVLIYFAWRSDRKAREDRAGLERV